MQESATRATSPLRILATGEAVTAWNASRATMLEQLKDVEQYGYGHDGKGGLPARPDAVAEVRHRLLGNYGMDLRNLPNPSISLSPRGEVVISFDLGKRTVSLMACCTGVVRYWQFSSGSMLVDGTIHLYTGPPATGLCYEIDEVTEWLLESQKEDWESTRRQLKKKVKS